MVVPSRSTNSARLHPRIPGARETAPKVGIQIASRPSTTATAAKPHHNNQQHDTTTSPQTPETPPQHTFDASIMHRVITPSLCDMDVRLDATSLDIASTFSVPVAYVAAHWITSRTPMTLPNVNPTSTSTSVMPMTAAATTTATATGGVSCMGAGAPSGRPPALSRFCSVDQPRACNPAVTRRMPLSPAQLAAYRDLAIALRRSLQPYVVPATSSTVPSTITTTNQTCGVTATTTAAAAMTSTMSNRCNITATAMSNTHTNRPPLHPLHPYYRPSRAASNATQERHPFEHDDDDDDDGDAAMHTLPLCLPPAKQQGSRTAATCAFATMGTHADLTLSADRFSVSKRRKGLYRVARSASPLHFSRTGVYYAEVAVTRAGGEGGLCIGVSGFDTPLNKLVGSQPASVGYHSTGRIVCKDVWQAVAASYTTGDVISLRVEMPMSNVGDSPVSGGEEDVTDVNGGTRNGVCNSVVCAAGTAAAAADVDVPRVSFFHNGRFVMTKELVHAGGCELFVMVSLYREGSGVTLRCCRSDWQFCHIADDKVTPVCGVQTRRDIALRHGVGKANGVAHGVGHGATVGAANDGAETCASVLTP